MLLLQIFFSPCNLFFCASDHCVRNPARRRHPLCHHHPPTWASRHIFGHGQFQILLSERKQEKMCHSEMGHAEDDTNLVLGSKHAHQALELCHSIGITCRHGSVEPSPPHTHTRSHVHTAFPANQSCILNDLTFVFFVWNLIKGCCVLPFRSIFRVWARVWVVGWWCGRPSPQCQASPWLAPTARRGVR